MTVHYISQCISRIAATVSSMNNIWIVLAHFGYSKDIQYNGAENG
jgi:2',3'-cyclic-nucleotide 2'-phosphodiesterase (5'-nucleotidase family)